MMRKQTAYWSHIPPWIILGAVFILVPIFVFWTFENINKQKEQMILLLLEKGAALIRSFEAGTRTGMMGMMGMRGGGFQLQNLLTETAQQPDIDYLIVTDIQGTILAHSDPSKIGRIYGRDLDLGGVFRSRRLHWRQVSHPESPATFEVYRRFSPAFVPHRRGRGMIMMMPRWQHDLPRPDWFEEDSKQIIFVGMDTGALEAARKEDMRHTVVMALVLLLIGFAGMVTLFLAQAYRSTRTSLTRIRAFSESVVENMPIGLVAVDGSGKVASFNQSAESVLGRAEHFLGKEASEVLPRELWGLSGDLGRGRKVLQKEINCPSGKGKSIPLEVSLSLLEGEDGISLGHIVLFRDLTEVEELKTEIERSRRLASLGRLAAGIAHEIRNPLSSIKGFATYFGERYRENPEDRSTAQIMIQEVERLNRVIGQLLEFARPMAVHKRPAPIHGVIHHALKMIERDAKEKGVTIRTTLPPEIREAMIDPDRINQVLLNLFLNAIEAMESGGTLSVGLARDNDGRGVGITVTDTGTGIGKEALNHVFEPYYTTKQAGTGLGLAIVHKIVESHGGEVRVESAPGKGTRVTVFLPAADD